MVKYIYKINTRTGVFVAVLLLLPLVAYAIVVTAPPRTLATGDVTTTEISDGTILGIDLNTTGTSTFQGITAGTTTPWQEAQFTLVYSTTSPGFVLSTESTTSPALFVTATGNLELNRVSSGLWRGTSIEIPFGGTGQTAFTAGDILFSDATNSLARRAIGTRGQILNIGSGLTPAWISTSTAFTAGIAYSWPQADGSASQFLSTNGSTVLSWVSAGNTMSTTTMTGDATSVDTGAGLCATDTVWNEATQAQFDTTINLTTVYVMFTAQLSTNGNPICTKFRFNGVEYPTGANHLWEERDVTVSPMIIMPTIYTATGTGAFKIEVLWQSNQNTIIMESTDPEAQMLVIELE